MALKRLTIDGYGQLEINNCAFRRDGRIEAQCKADPTYFSNHPVENGMLLAVDNVNRVVKIASDDSLPIAINYSAEHIYDERTPGLKSFALKGDGTDFLPRLGYLAVGDKFTTNCISYDGGEWANDSAFITALGSIGTTAVYGGAGADGAITCSTSAPTFGPKLKAVAKTTMPNGTIGVKFQVLAC